MGTIWLFINNNLCGENVPVAIFVSKKMLLVDTFLVAKYFLLERSSCGELVGKLLRKKCFFGNFLCSETLKTKCGQSVPMPRNAGLFASAKCPHAQKCRPFCQCKVSPCAYMGAFLPVQSVPMRIYGGLLRFCSRRMSTKCSSGAFVKRALFPHPPLRGHRGL